MGTPGCLHPSWRLVDRVGRRLGLLGTIIAAHIAGTAQNKHGYERNGDDGEKDDKRAAGHDKRSKAERDMDSPTMGHAQGSAPARIAKHMQP